MRTGMATAFNDARFDVPPVFAVAERRMAGRALDLWRVGGGRAVAGFEAHCLIVADPDGMAIIQTVGEALASAFGFAAGMLLDGPSGLATEIRAASSLVVRGCQPVPFEATWRAPGGAAFVARGIALPIDVVDEPMPKHVQVIVNWREVLDRAATTRLRRELVGAFRIFNPDLAKIDPFTLELPN